MREIGSIYRLAIFLFTAAIFAVIFLLDQLGFSANEIIAATCFVATAGLATMLTHFLRTNSN